MPTVATAAAEAPVSAFAGFPARTLLETGRLPLADLAGIACREGQATSPLFRVHRWFARRLSSQFRAILTALSLPDDGGRRFWGRYLGDIPLCDAVVLDPFVGGGTTLAEASRCGARVIGFDIDPVAAFITRFELELLGRPGLPFCTSALCDAVEADVASYHRTVLPGGREAVVLHHFWVEVVECPECARRVDLHPHHQLAYHTASGLQWVACRACDAAHEKPLDKQVLHCGCGVRTRIAVGPVARGRVTCPDCRSVWGLAEHRSPNRRPTWRLFAQEYLEPIPPGAAGRVRRAFKQATADDVQRYSNATVALAALEAREGALAPTRPIPGEHRSDRRPLLYGFRTYRDFFNDRQLLHLTALGRAILRVENSSDRRLFGLAFSEHLTTNCMYTGYAFGYRRTSPMFSIHGYRHITRPVELNPWLDGIGRGTFRNALAKIERAHAFVRAPQDMDPRGGKRVSSAAIGVTTRVAGDAQSVTRGRARAAIVAAASQAVASMDAGSVDLVLTDPPYFDNISYSELSDFYLAWHQQLGIAAGEYRDVARPAPMTTSLAITSRSTDAVTRYREELATIFCGARRVLRPSGIMVFTYHHESPAAWMSIAYALRASGLRCTAVVPMRGEGQGGLHSYEGTIKWDAVLVCRPPDDNTVPGRPTSKADATPADASTDRDLPLVVSPDDLRRAIRTVGAYTRRIGDDRTAGFRERDRVNLYRALLAAAARASEPAPRDIPLLEALRKVDLD